MLNRLLFASVATMIPLHVSAAPAVQTFDLGVESMRSQGYSVGIFIFMMIAIAVFVGIIVGYFRSQQEKLKPGEKVLFALIALGVMAASVFAAVQLLDGFLF